MKNCKKIVLAMLCMAVVLGTVACGNSNGNPNDTNNTTNNGTNNDHRDDVNDNNVADDIGNAV